jgi:hypothetical protein
MFDGIIRKWFYGEVYGDLDARHIVIYECAIPRQSALLKIMKFIALLGKSRVGKDTAAAILSSTLGFPIVRLSSPIKDACHVLFDIPREHLDSAMKEVVDPRYGKTPRDLMVWMTAAVRAQLPVDFFFQRLLSRCPKEAPGIIVPDVRYGPDLDLFRSRKALVLKISRVGAPVVHSHEDHIDALECDALLKNDGTLQDFEKRVRCVAECIKRALESE